MKTTGVATKRGIKFYSGHKFYKKHKASTKVIAISLAFLMAFSALSANVTSMVNLLKASAGAYTLADDYYPVDIELYDYYSDNAMGGGTDNEAAFFPSDKLPDGRSSGEKIAKKTSGKFVFRKATSGEYSGTYVYDSSKQYLSYQDSSSTEDGKFHLQVEADEGTNGAKLIKDSKGNSAFFPWDVMGSTPTKTKSQNYGFGAIFTIKFTMTTTGYLSNPSTGEVQTDSGGNPIPIKFGFTGDDDVWVFIDDMLVLDVGGAHGEVSGSINFATRQSKTETVKTSTYYNQNGDATSGSGTARNLKDLLGEEKFKALYFDTAMEHTLKVFYLERGTIESNCKLSFNFTPFDTLDVRSKYKSDNVGEWFKTEAEKVAKREAVKFEVQSAGGTLNVASPDTGKSVTDRLQASRKCKVQWSDSTNGVSGNKTAAPGDTVKLPDGFDKRAGYYILGWQKDGDSSGTLYNSYTIPTNASDGATYSFINPVWAKVPDLSAASTSSISEVPKPSYMLVAGAKTKQTLNSVSDSLPWKNIRDSGYDYGDRYYYFINFIGQIDNHTSKNWYFKANTDSGEKQMPSKDGGVTKNDYTDGKINMNDDNFGGSKEGYFYFFKIKAL